MANAMIEIETQHGAPTQILCEPTPPAVTESRGKAHPLCEEGRHPHARTTTHLEVQNQVPPAETQSSEAVRPLRKPTATHNRLSRTNTKAASAALNEPSAVTERKRKATQTEIQPMQLVRVISFGEERSPLIEFLNRFAKVKLADVIDSGKAGRSSADPESLNELMDGLKRPAWRRLCGNFDGLLCLIPPNRENRGAAQRISGRTYYELNQHDIQQPHSLLGSDKSMPLFQIGNTLQMSVWQNMEVPEFEWESEDPLELDRLSAKELAPFMKKFHIPFLV
ncbi:hypothetical protein DL95DRAFT_493964 [Leptodontidium sp. 2 PMI_412]|nr:hypothetical protein DL95DRAFT_493964 [Leptodontidium sp. 2 PMI_412]